MRIWPVTFAVVAAAVVASHAYGDSLVSPRLASLAAKVAAKERGAEDDFWKQVAGEGTPIVEDTQDPNGRLLVTFVYRAKPDTHDVAMYNAPSGEVGGYARLERLAGTGVFAYSVLADPATRLSYVLAPGDDLGPPKKSGNAHDSLGEAYWHAGDRPRAVASYQRALALDPKNDNAKRMIELLR